MNKMYEIFVRNCFNEQQKYLFIGNKEKLMTLIGCMYSTSLIKIERIDYCVITKIPKSLTDRISYYIKNDEIFIAREFIKMEEQEND